MLSFLSYLTTSFEWVAKLVLFCSTLYSPSEHWCRFPNFMVKDTIPFLLHPGHFNCVSCILSSSVIPMSKLYFLHSTLDGASIWVSPSQQSTKNCFCYSFVYILIGWVSLSSYWILMLPVCIEQFKDQFTSDGK